MSKEQGRSNEEMKSQDQKAKLKAEGSKNWGQIYGEATGQIAKLIDKQAKLIEDQGKKKKKTGNQKPQGKQGAGAKSGEKGKKSDQKQQKYYLGSTLGEKKGVYF